MTESAGASIEERIVRTVAGDGAAADLHLLQPSTTVRDAIVWLPALGVAARNYLPFARAMAARGITVALHEWRGIGSSDRRAGRESNWGYRELLTLDIPATLAATRGSFADARVWIGGHSLGGQLASLYAALHPDEFAGLLMIASGAPYWRCFPWRRMVGPMVVLAPWIAALRGHFPGRRVGFGGNEARSLIADWARSGRSGRYAAVGMAEDFEQHLAALSMPVLALRLSDDWLGPPASLAWLLGKMPRAKIETPELSAPDLGGIAADHFAWMKSPAAIVDHMVDYIVRVPASS